MIRIGIDAKWYISGNPSGKVVVKNIIDQIICLESKNEYVLFIQNKDKKLTQDLELKIKKKINVKIVYCFTSINFLSNIFIIPFYAKRHKVDICLYQNFTPFLFSKSIKNVVYIHDFLFFDYPQYYSLIERTIFKYMKTTARFAKSIITISQSEQHRIMKYTGFPIEKVHFVYHGVSNDFMCKSETDEVINEKYNLPKKYILFLGRINVRKNIELLLEVMPEIDANIHLLIIGGKDHKSFDIDSLITNLKIRNRVLLLGHIDFNSLTKILSQAYLFVFPSFAEGFGLPPLEAMKSGIPVIVSESTCLPEICGEAALYFNPKSKKELLFQINRINNDEGLYKEMLLKGLKHSENFTWSKTVQKILFILEKEANEV